MTTVGFVMLNFQKEFMNKKIRLITTYKCNRACEGCCNNDWSFEPAIKIKEENLVEEINRQGFDEILITGGEPTLFNSNLYNLLNNLKSNTNCRIILYTAQPWQAKDYIQYIDGITLTLHDNVAVCDFVDVKLSEYYDKKEVEKKSLRLNIFKEANINEKIICDFWKIKYVEWIEDCPLPENETLYELENLW